MAYSEEIAQAICARIAEGEPLRVICREEGMPKKTQVYSWADPEHKDYVPEFAGRFARARKEGFDALAEEALESSNTPLEGVEITKDEKGTTEKRGDMLGHRKLQIETRLKLLAKWDPKRYGDKQTVDVGNKEGETLKVDSNVDTVALTLQLAEALRSAGDDK